jgi:hypothetical protein
MLEAHDSVVRVAHDDHVAGGASLPPLVDPLIVDMMEVNVRQERADAAPCGVPSSVSITRPSSSTPAWQHLVDTWRCSLLQSEEACAQDVNVDVMQERRQLVLFVPDDGFSYAGLRS